MADGTGHMQRAVHLVRRLLDGDHRDDAEADEIHEELNRLLPDPAWSDLIYWPAQHPRSASLDPAELTAEKIVELAMRYKPFAL